MNRSLDHLARRVVESGAAPVAACIACGHSAGTWTCSAGLATVDESRARAGAPLVFDLASLTKPFLAVAVHRAVVRGQFSDTTPLAELIPGLEGTWAGRRNLGQLLSHRAGLLPHVELFEALKARRCPTRLQLLRITADSWGTAVLGDSGNYPPVYSDLGYILAGAALEAYFGIPLDQWLTQQLAELKVDGVGSARQWMRRHMEPPRFVPTEVVPWRGGLLKGIVHDENAWLLSGHGLSGHAGLFGTAQAVADFGMYLLDSIAGRGGAIDREAVRRATRRRPDGSLCSGFDRRLDFGSSAGTHCGRETFGHVGFTGTSLWCDPEQDAVVVLLTNRVCPSRENLRIKALRPILHDALFQWARSPGG